MRRGGLVRAAAAVVVAAVLAVGCGAGKKRAGRISSEERYRQALAFMEKEDYARARAILGEIGVRELQETTLDPQVKLTLADAFYLDGGIANVIEAQSRYEQFLNFYPSDEKASYAQYQVGMCLFKQSAKPFHDQEYTRRALDEFGKVKAIAPASEFVAKADEMRDRCSEKLAEHEYEVGRFYFRRKACEAASGRFRGILKDYPRFSDIEASTFYLGQSLLCSNNVEEGKIYLSKLIEEHPQSEYAAKAREALASRRG
jgi:outer membrane protein assembly factor BamD